MTQQEFKANENIDKRIKSFCHQCNRQTNQTIRANYEEHYSDEDHGFSFGAHFDFQIIQCDGCNTISFRQISSNSEDLEEYSNAYGEPDSKYAERENLYPQKKRSKTINPEFYHYIPRKCREIYQETDEALSNNLEILAAAGLRALVEAICKDLIKNEDKSTRTLNKKIDFLVAKGHLLKVQSEILHSIRSMGNDSLHEIDKQNISQLNLAMEVLENLLNTLYILPQRHSNNR